MYNKTSKATHYLPRTASYSTHPHRNGRVDVLPVGASENLYDVCNQIADGEDRIRLLRIDGDDLKSVLAKKRKFSELQSKFASRQSDDSSIAEAQKRLSEIESEKRRIRLHINSLKTLLRSAQVDLPTAFYAIAKAELSPSTFQLICDKASLLVSRTKATP